MFCGHNFVQGWIRGYNFIYAVVTELHKHSLLLFGRLGH